MTTTGAGRLGVLKTRSSTPWKFLSHSCAKNISYSLQARGSSSFWELHRHSSSARSRSCNARKQLRRNGALDSTLHEYVCEGPLLDLCKIDMSAVQDDSDLWQDLANVICQSLGLDIDNLTESERMRIFQYYLPVFFWCWNQVKAHKAAGNSRPLVIGMQAVQGCGKTTLVEQLQELFTHIGLQAASVSIDDFYLPYAGQQQLIQENKDNFLLGVRGNALTHDVELGRSTLESLLKLNEGAESELKVPRYDKSAYEGKGDRADKAEWPVIKAPVDVILFEGWMLGFTPVADETASQIDKDLVPINRRLQTYVDSWDVFVDAWLVIKVSNPAFVFTWRQQAESAMKAAGKTGMSDEQVRDFVNRYMPAYKAYLPVMYDKGPSTGKGENFIIFEIDESRGLLQRKIPDV